MADNSDVVNMVIFIYSFQYIVTMLIEWSRWSLSNNRQVIIGYGLYDYRPLMYEDYTYPSWANVLGWCIAGSSILMIPAVAVYQIAITPGTLRQVSWGSPLQEALVLLEEFLSWVTFTFLTHDYRTGIV